MSWMAAEIAARGGAVPFDEYMELALYHPAQGYYASDTVRYGRAGDFLTAPTASGWYARVVARLLRKIAAERGRLRLADAASGDGSFLEKLLESFGVDAGEVIAEVISVERSPAMRSLQSERLAQAPVAVRMIRGVEQLGRFPGPTVVHASEFYDAQPVTRVVGRRGGLREQWVIAPEGRLEWQEKPARREVMAYFERHGVVLEEGQIAEANLRAATVHRRLLAEVGEKGLALVLDYGYETRRLYDARGRRGGSLATFHRHRVGRDPLENPGEVDLTAHVNWDDLRNAAEAEGWVEVGLWPLAEFLVRAGIEQELADRGLGMEAELDADTVTARQEVKRLLDPEGMGSDLKVLVQAKGEMVETARSVLSFELPAR